MKALILICLAAISFSCGKPSLIASSPTPTLPTPEAKTTNLTLSDVTTALMAAKLPIKDPMVYNEVTDGNHLLGRPHAYVEKMNFTDERIKSLGKPQSEIERDMRRKCSIEIFIEQQDAQARMTYVDALGRGTPMFLTYSYLYKNVLLRLDHELLPSQAEEYKKILESL